MDLTEALTFARDRTQGVLCTNRRNGRPQLSNLVYRFDGDLARISVTDDRAKTKNLRRDPRASLYVAGDDFWTYAVLEGDVELTPVAADPGDAVVEELVTLYRQLQGEHPDWGEFRRAMVDDRRLVLRFRPDRAYGQLPR